MGKACNYLRTSADGLLKLGASKQIIDHSPGLLTLYSDGTFERLTDLDRPACPDYHDGVASRDVVIDASAGIWARIFLPSSVTQLSRYARLPVVLHFHGGGFCVGTPASPHVHSYCSRMARITSCLWISVHYRLAPEHPLPAAYEDAYTSLVWLRAQAEDMTMRRFGDEGKENLHPKKFDKHVKNPWENYAKKDTNGLFMAVNGSITRDPWLGRYADFSKCFITGDSSGGTLVHYLAAQASGQDWKPLSIKGLLLLHPAFPQEEPKSSDDLTNQRVQFYHTSSLPPGAPFGHPLMNPLHPDSAIKLSDITISPMFLAVAERDPLRPGELAYYQALLKAGYNAELFESRGVGHCFHTNLHQRHAETEVLEGAIVEFIRKHLG